MYIEIIQRTNYKNSAKMNIEIHEFNHFSSFYSLTVDNYFQQ